MTEIGGSSDGAEARAQKALEDLAKSYRDQFAASTARTGTTLLSWAAALLILLISPIVPLMHQVTARARTLRGLSIQVARYRREYREAEAMVERNEASPGSSKPEKTRLHISEDRYREELYKVQKIKTPLGDIEVPSASVPPLYSLLLAGFVGYLLHRRLVLNAMALRVVQLHTEALHRPAEELRGFGAWAPFWLAPLPSILRDESSQTTVEKAEEARLDFLGWRTSVRRKAVLFWMIVIAAALVWIRVILLARGIDAVHPGAPSIVERWQTHAALFMVMVVIFILYVRPVAIWGAFPEQLAVESRTRRAFLGTSVVAIGALAGIAAMPRSYLRFVPLLRSPRFRCRKRQNLALNPALRGKLVFHHKTHVVRYVDQSGWMIGRPNLTSKRLKVFNDLHAIEENVRARSASLVQPPTQTVKAPPSVATSASVRQATVSSTIAEPTMTIVGRALPNAVVPPGSLVPLAPSERRGTYHFEVLRSGAICERLALDQATHNVTEALRITWTGILLDAQSSRRTPNYRLYDLFVGLAHRARLDAAKSEFQLALLIQNRGWSDDARLQQVVELLRNPNPPKNWSQRWKAADLLWSTSSPKPQKKTGTKPRKRRRRKSKLPNRGTMPTGASVF